MNGKHVDLPHESFMGANFSGSGIASVDKDLDPPAHDGFVATTINAPAMGAMAPFGLDMIWPHWPPNLPNAELLKHL